MKLKLAKIKKSRAVIFIIPIIFSFSVPLTADTNLNFEVRKLSLDPKGSVIENNLNSVQDIQVSLGKNHFSVDDGREKSIYDFEKRQIIKINDSNKKYRIYSLYSLIGFRAAEIQNRNSLSKILKEKVSEYYLNPELSEHKFSIKINEDSGKLQILEDTHKKVYKVGDWTLAEIARKGEAISREEALVFLKFLRYHLGGHPEILENILKDTLIPENFNLNFYGKDAAAVIYKLKKIERTREAPYSLEALNVEPSVSGEAFSSYLNQISRENKETSVQKMAAVQVDIQESLDKQKYLEAMLGCMESGLYNSRFDIDICQKNISNMQKDPDVKTFFKYLNTNENVTSTDAYLKLKSIEEPAGEKVYVLKIFEANLIARTGKTGDAFKMIFEALKINPYITGVYKDLGELFYNNYSTDLAWLCWDTGRKIYPEHSMLKEITKLEEDLVKKYPEYF